MQESLIFDKLFLIMQKRNNLLSISLKKFFALGGGLQLNELAIYPIESC